MSDTETLAAGGIDSADPVAILTSGLAQSQSQSGGNTGTQTDWQSQNPDDRPDVAQWGDGILVTDLFLPLAIVLQEVISSARYDYIRVQNDTSSKLVVTFYDGNGAVLDLTKAQSVQLYTRKVGASALKINGALMTLATDKTTGQVSYAFQSGDVNEEGAFYALFEITWQDGSTSRAPTDRRMLWRFLPDLSLV